MSFKINKRSIGQNHPTYIIAELSCNHNQDKNIALKLIEEAHKAGADAIKLQTYTQDTMTIDCSNSYFIDCLKGTLWEGETLYQLYSRAYTPWEWTKELKDYANSLGMDLFSSPFDTTAVDYLETLDIPAYKIASFEIVDHVLIKRIAQTGKPVIISSGMASFQELEEAIDLLRNNGCSQICMLKCTSAYPAKSEDANLITMKDMAEKFGYGAISGIDLYGEKAGNIPGIEYMNKKYGKFGWAAGNLLTFVIGQGDVLVTPIQVVKMINLIASRGNTNMPSFHINNSPNEVKLSFQSSTWDLLHNAMWNVVNHKDGTGKLARVEGADIYGKTGTAQNPHGEDHSWFAGYMNIENEPILSLVVLVEHGGKGSIEGAIISRKIFEFVLQNELIQ